MNKENKKIKKNKDKDKNINIKKKKKKLKKKKVNKRKIKEENDKKIQELLNSINNNIETTVKKNHEKKKEKKEKIKKIEKSQVEFDQIDASIIPDKNNLLSDVISLNNISTFNANPISKVKKNKVIDINFISSNIVYVNTEEDDNNETRIKNYMKSVKNEFKLKLIKKLNKIKKKLLVIITMVFLWLNLINLIFFFNILNINKIVNYYWIIPVYGLYFAIKIIYLGSYKYIYKHKKSDKILFSLIFILQIISLISLNYYINSELLLIWFIILKIFNITHYYIIKKFKIIYIFTIIMIILAFILGLLILKIQTLQLILIIFISFLFSIYLNLEINFLKNYIKILNIKHYNNNLKKIYFSFWLNFLFFFLIFLNNKKKKNRL